MGFFPVIRKTWSSEEVQDLKRHFKEHLEAKTVPKRKDCQQIIKKSEHLKKRTPELIIKKISALNH